MLATRPARPGERCAGRRANEKLRCAAWVPLAVVLCVGCGGGGTSRPDRLARNVAERLGCSSSYTAGSTAAPVIGKCTFRGLHVSIITFQSNADRNTYICSTCGFDADNRRANDRTDRLPSRRQFRRWQPLPCTGAGRAGGTSSQGRSRLNQLLEHLAAALVSSTAFRTGPPESALACATVLSLERRNPADISWELSQTRSHTARQDLANDCFKTFSTKPQRVFKTCAVW